MVRFLFFTKFERNPTIFRDLPIICPSRWELLPWKSYYIKHIAYTFPIFWYLVSLRQTLKLFDLAGRWMLRRPSRKSSAIPPRSSIWCNEIEQNVMTEISEMGVEFPHGNFIRDKIHQEKKTVNVFGCLSLVGAQRLAIPLTFRRAAISTKETYFGGCHDAITRQFFFYIKCANSTFRDLIRSSAVVRLLIVPNHQSRF